MIRECWIHSVSLAVIQHLSKLLGSLCVTSPTENSFSSRKPSAPFQYETINALLAPWVALTTEFEISTVITFSGRNGSQVHLAGTSTN